MSYTTEQAVRQVNEVKAFLSRKVEDVAHLREYNTPGTVGYEPGMRVVEFLQDVNEIKLQEQIRALSTRSSIASPDEMKRCLPSNVDIETLRIDAAKDFYSYSAVEALGCAVGAVFYGISEDHGDVAHVANLKSEIRGIHKVGGPSVSGHALAGGIGDSEDLYIVKVPQRQDSERDLSHELFAAINGINSLRKGKNGKPGVPNFAMVLAGAVCSPAVISEDKTATVCSGVGDKVQYTIYENIAPATTLAKYIVTADVYEFLSVYSQKLRSLDIASHYIGYTHYDDHTENNMMRTTDKLGKFSIPYEVPGTDRIEYVTANAVCTAIDYGMCSIQYNGDSYGAYDAGMTAYGVKGGPNPLHDAYKVLMFMGRDLLKAGKGKGAVFQEAAKIFRYFNRYESFESCVVNQGPESDLYYSFIPGPGTNDLSLAGLIDHVSSVCDLNGIVTAEPIHPVLACGGKGSIHPHDRCFTFQGEINKAEKAKTTPDSFLEFYDVYLHTDNKADLVKKFDYEKAKKHFLNLLREEIELLERNLKGKELASVPAIEPGVTEGMLRSDDLVNTLSKGFAQVLTAVSAYENGSTWLKIGENVSTLYQDQETVDKIQSMRQEIESNNAKISEAVGVYRSNYRNMTPVIESDRWINLLHSYYPWYRDSSSAIIGLVDRINGDQSHLYVPLQLPAAIVPNTHGTNRDSLLPPKRRTTMVRTPEGNPLKVVSNS